MDSTPFKPAVKPGFRDHFMDKYFTESYPDENCKKVLVRWKYEKEPGVVCDRELIRRNETLCNLRKHLNVIKLKIKYPEFMYMYVISVGSAQRKL